MYERWMLPVMWLIKLFAENGRVDVENNKDRAMAWFYTIQNDLSKMLIVCHRSAKSSIVCHMSPVVCQLSFSIFSYFVQISSFFSFFFSYQLKARRSFIPKTKRKSYIKLILKCLVSSLSVSTHYFHPHFFLLSSCMYTKSNLYKFTLHIYSPRIAEREERQKIKNIWNELNMKTFLTYYIISINCSTKRWRKKKIGRAKKEREEKNWKKEKKGEPNMVNLKIYVISFFYSLHFFLSFFYINFY